MSPMPLRVLIVDDSALYRQMLVNVVTRIPDTEVVGTACDGLEAVSMATSLVPHVATLDVQMPGLDGIGVLRLLRERKNPMKAIVVSSLTQEGAPAATEVLLEGAFDVLAKPIGMPPHEARQFLHGQLVEKLAAIRASLEPVPRRTAVCESVPATPSALPFDVVAIGASTGGPHVLRQIIPRLPKDFSAAVLVVQHMPPMFTSSLAARLDDLSPLRVTEAADGMAVDPGTVVIAAGARHLRVRGKPGSVRCVTDDSPPLHGCRPSFDVLMESLVPVYGARSLAVILTGMGRDGLQACRLVKQAGGRVLAQSAETCAVYGMPKVVVDAGLADAILAPEQVAAILSRRHR